MKTCYYELLDVSTDATESELKKAYRKKALQLHPDKNPDNVEEANLRFSLVRSAYEVLIDPQERAWYDSHKQSILNDEDVYEDDGGESHIPSISTDEILKYFNSNLYQNYNDSISGFYSTVSRLFERLAREEIQHGKYQNLQEFMGLKDDENNVYTIDPTYLKYPLFGNSHLDYLSIKQFYNVWTSFTTIKTFNWKYQYRYSTAEDRRTRRLMEKENKKLSDFAKKEYNETIRKFVNFIKKRDPRVKTAQQEFEKQQQLKKTKEIEQQLKNQKLQKIQQQQNQDYKEQDWQKLTLEEIEEMENMIQQEYHEINDTTTTQKTDSEYESDLEQEEIHEFECIVCNKIMKNKQQFEIHEESKKHKKAVRQMKWEMKQEGIDLGIDDEDEEDEEFETAESEFSSDLENDLENLSDDELDAVLNGDENGQNEIEEELKEENEEKLPETRKKSIQPKEEAKPKKKEENSNVTEDNKLEQELSTLLDSSTLDSDDDWKTPKKNQKKPKKKPTTKIIPSQQQSKESTPITETSSSGTEKCSVCGLKFESRNQLFNHVKELNHAAPPESNGSKKKKSKKR